MSLNPLNFFRTEKKERVPEPTKVKPERAADQMKNSQINTNSNNSKNDTENASLMTNKAKEMKTSFVKEEKLTKRDLAIEEEYKGLLIKKSSQYSNFPESEIVFVAIKNIVLAKNIDEKEKSSFIKRHLNEVEGSVNMVISEPGSLNRSAITTTIFACLASVQECKFDTGRLIHELTTQDPIDNIIVAMLKEMIKNPEFAPKLYEMKTFFESKVGSAGTLAALENTFNNYGHQGGGKKEITDIFSKVYNDQISYAVNYANNENIPMLSKEMKAAQESESNKKEELLRFTNKLQETDPNAVLTKKEEWSGLLPMPLHIMKYLDNNPSLRDKLNTLIENSCKEEAAKDTFKFKSLSDGGESLRLPSSLVRAQSETMNNMFGDVDSSSTPEDVESLPINFNTDVLNEFANCLKDKIPTDMKNDKALLELADFYHVEGLVDFLQERIGNAQPKMEHPEVTGAQMVMNPATRKVLDKIKNEKDKEMRAHDKELAKTKAKELEEKRKDQKYHDKMKQQRAEWSAKADASPKMTAIDLNFPGNLIRVAKKIKDEGTLPHKQEDMKRFFQTNSVVIENELNQHFNSGENARNIDAVGGLLLIHLKYNPEYIKNYLNYNGVFQKFAGEEVANQYKSLIDNYNK